MLYEVITVEQGSQGNSPLPREEQRFLDVLWSLPVYRRGHLPRKLLEIVGLGDKVGLAVYLDKRRGRITSYNVCYTKLLRAGMMDCKKALTESGGDTEAAVDVLRKKGLAAAAKKASRIASEGTVTAYVAARNNFV